MPRHPIGPLFTTQRPWGGWHVACDPAQKGDRLGVGFGAVTSEISNVGHTLMNMQNKLFDGRCE